MTASPRQTPLHLTRRILSAYARYAEAQSDLQWRNVACWAGLCGAEVEALERLRVNAESLGPTDEWCCRLPSGIWATMPQVAPTLLTGLWMSVSSAIALVRAVGVKPWLWQTPLEQAIKEHLMTMEETKMEIQHEHDRREEQAETEPEGEKRTIRERLADLADDGHLDLTQPLFNEAKERLAQELGASAGTIGAEIHRLRKERGIARQPYSHFTEKAKNGHRAAATAEDAPPSEVSLIAPDPSFSETDFAPIAESEPLAPPPVPVPLTLLPPEPGLREAAAAVHGVLIEWGIAGVEPEELHDPLRQLMAALLAGG